MVKEIVFHLGDPKTGTTSIQEALAARSWRCDGVDLLYTAPINHLPLASTLFEKSERPLREPRWRDLADAVAASDADIAVVSAELFERIDPQELGQALEEFLPSYAGTARFIAYVRPHADRLVSAYAERIKRGFTTANLEEVYQHILVSGQLRYAPRFRKWRALFGDRFTVRPMIRANLKDQDVVTDFLDFVFQGRNFELINNSATNESLSLEDLALMREFHLQAKEHPELRNARLAIGWHFGMYLAGLPRQKGTKLRLHRPLVSEVVANFREDAAEMDADFFGGEPTLLPALLAAESRAGEEAQSIRAEDHFPPDELRMIRLWAALSVQMLEHRPDAVAGYFRQRQRAIILSRQRDNDPEAPEEARMPRRKAHRKALGLAPKGRAGGAGKRAKAAAGRGLGGDAS